MKRLMKRDFTPAPNSESHGEWYCDTDADLESIASPNLGDTALVVTTGSVYVADSTGAWHKL